MLVGNKHYRTVWMEGSIVKMINQNLLPFKFEILEAPTYLDTCKAILDMNVRGAGAIGATAGFAMAQGIIEGSPETARATIEATRRTAQNLFFATKRVSDVTAYSANSSKDAFIEAQAIADEDAISCQKIGQFGAKLLKDDMNILTHCNAGWLAFVDWGSALSPVYVAHRNGMKLRVLADETRPRGQGGRLTAWELKNEGVNYAVVPDTAAAFLMEHSEVDIVIVGADRIAASGDVANKLGTQALARLARDFGIDFYVAAPTSTIDPLCPNGKAIKIEKRDSKEVSHQTGQTKDGRVEEMLVISPGSPAYNPASFDVTPASLIKGIITQNGIFEPSKIMNAYGTK